MSDWLPNYLATFSERKAWEDYSIWSRPLDAHSYGEFSIAAVKTGLIMEDNSQVEAGQNATVVGVYDGHGHPLASDYVSEKLFHHLLEAANENDAITGVLKHAFQKTEEGFIDIVKNFPEYTAIGSCCLVGVIWKGKLYVANLGDSGAVLGYLDSDNMIRSKGLTQSHHISERIRNELLADHPDDPELLIQNMESDYKIKGVIEVSRTIGDAYLKRIRE
ncbi:hypothetical protein Leryth_016231 [Lithospermum erythrorhizon]|nr:hypothetical protein Leryth_016231 [Lithospermum erythrorhizon]